MTLRFGKVLIRHVILFGIKAAALLLIVAARVDFGSAQPVLAFNDQATAQTSSAAAAGKPLIEIIPITSFTVQESVCGFPVLVEVLPQGLGPKLITFFDREGNVRFQLFTGGNFVRLTNLSTAKSVTLNNSGFGRFETQADGNTKGTIAGGTVFVLAPGLPPLAYARGRVDFVLDAAGNILSFDTLHAQVQDVCSLLS